MRCTQFLKIQTFVALLVLCIGGFFSSLRGDSGRFFSPSTWYYPVPANPQIHPDSAKYVAFLKSVGNISISNSEWSVPIYYATSSDPLVNFTCTSTSTYVQQAVNANKYNLNVPLPPGAKPAGAAAAATGQYRDQHMVIISPDQRQCWDFYFFRGSVDSRKTDRVKRWDLTSPGIANGINGEPHIQLGGNCRVSPCPLLQGLVTYDEVQQGQINHAIAYSVYSQGASPGVYPCQGANTMGLPPYAPWLGMRFQLDPSWNVETSGLSAAGKIVARALQVYGMIFVENNGPGSSGVYFEDLEWHPTKKWSQLGVSSGSISSVPVDRFRQILPVMSGGSAPPPPPATNVNVTQTAPPVTQPQTSQQSPVYQTPPPTSGGGSPSGPSVSDISVPFLIAGVLGAALILGSD